LEIDFILSFFDNTLSKRIIIKKKHVSLDEITIHLSKERKKMKLLKQNELFSDDCQKDYFQTKTDEINK
jgi:hypothetical protein